jgi:cyclic beta-1,2-glucan synthetase
LEKGIFLDTTTREKDTRLAAKDIVSKCENNIFISKNFSKKLIIQFHHNQKVISSQYLLLKEKYKKEKEPSAADVWIMENFRLITDVFDRLENSLNIDFLSSLPISKKTGNIRIYDCINYYVWGSVRPVEKSGLKKFIEHYQDQENLKIAELWSIPTMVDLALVQYLSQEIINSKNSKKEGQPSEIKIKKVILSFLKTSEINWKNFVESTSLVERTLRKDPAHLYSLMDFKTRDAYRHRIEEIAKKSNIGELSLAQKVLELSRLEKSTDIEKRHVGFYLSGSKRELLESKINYRKTFTEKFHIALKKSGGFYYVFSTFIIAALFVLLFIYSASSIGINYLVPFSILFGIPALAAGELFTRFFLIRIFKPQLLFKMDSSPSISIKDRALVIIATQISEKKEEVDEIIRNLESNFLANQDENIFYGLALSFSDTISKDPAPSRAEQESLNYLLEKMDKMNKKYKRISHPVFSCFFRERFWCESENACIEWERKRGKIEELNRLLRGDKDTSYSLVTANNDFLHTIKYLITLDQGEYMPTETAKKLIGTISHPLNKAKIDSQKNVVVSGYGIIQPRMSQHASQKTSSFMRYFIGSDGWDSYSGAVSNIYQDLNNEGLFLGKGIIDVDIFIKVLKNRFPQDAVLSHDHVEGFYLRTGYASDIQVYEDNPDNYLSYKKRLERWVRGDWQNLIWLQPKVKNAEGIKENNPLLFHQKVKIISNLLGSLNIFFIATIVLSAWFSLNGVVQKQVVIWAIFFLYVPILVEFFEWFLGVKAFKAWRFLGSELREHLLRIFFKAFFSFFTLFDIALTNFLAITKSLSRILITKKKRLEWSIFHRTKGQAGGLIDYINKMKSSLVPLGLFVPVFFFLEKDIPSYYYLFFLAPLFLYLSSLRMGAHNPQISTQETNRLRIIFLKTWRYFNENVSEKSNYLPPDHFQETDKNSSAKMTSITNIGMYLLSLEAAYDMGHLSYQRLLEKSSLTLASLNGLERHNGLFFNWYNIANLKALPPRYISTVDGGNLAAALVVHEQFLNSIFEKPLFSSNLGDAFNDILIMIRRSLALQPKSSTKKSLLELDSLFLSFKKTKSATELIPLFTRASELLKNIAEKSHLNASEKAGLAHWLSELSFLLEEQKRLLLIYYPWLSKKDSGSFNEYYAELNLLDSPSNRLKVLEKALQNAPQIKKLFKDKSYEEHLRELRGVIEKIKIDKNQARAQAEICRALVLEMDFTLLYNQDRHLFYIGYNLDSKKYDRNHYDLFASESRLASYVAIAKKDAPLEHWTTLSKPIAVRDGRVAIMSWGGSIFEYFFSQIFLPNYQNTLMSEALSATFSVHLNFAEKNNIPWGISESSYGRQAKNRDYLYKIHGVPSLALRHVKKNDLVAAPYATFLAMAQSPQKAIKNIIRLQHLGAEGKYGFYESIDYNDYQRGKDPIIRTYMSHHQGAIMLSIVNLLQDGIYQKRFFNNKMMAGLGFVLEEKFSHKLKLPKTGLKNKAKLTIPGDFKLIGEPNQRMHLGTPLFHPLSSDRMRAIFSTKGTGYIGYGNLELTRFKYDPQINHFGQFFYLKDEKTKKIWSVGLEPTLIEPEHYEVKTGENYFSLTRIDKGVHAELECFFLEKRKTIVYAVSLTNKTKLKKEISITSFSDVSLSSHAELEAHPNFYKMKIKEEIFEKEKAILASKLVPVGEKRPYFGHLVVSKNKQKTAFEVSREEFLGNGNIKSPDFILNDSKKIIPGSYPLDPIFSIKQEVDLLPLESKKTYFIYFYENNKERAESLIKELSSYDNLRKIIENTNFKKESEQNFEILQKIITLIFYNKSGAFKESAPPGQCPGASIYPEHLGIRADWPNIYIGVPEEFSELFIREAVKNLSYLMNHGLEFNTVIVTEDKDGYFQEGHSFVQRMIEESQQNGQRLNFTLVPKSGIKKEEDDILRSTSALYLEAKKKSFTAVVEEEFKEIC